MPLVENEKAVWITLNGKEGNFRTGSKASGYEYHDAFEGTLVGCRFEEDEYEGKPTYRYVYEFDTPVRSDSDTNSKRENIVVSVGTIASSNLINCLASVGGDIGTVKISPYLITVGSRQVATVAVRHNGDKLSWAIDNNDLPPVGKERNKFFHEMFLQIQKKLGGQGPAPSTNGQPPSDDPFGGSGSPHQNEVDKAVSEADAGLPF